jgi:hypothetical protein
MYILCIYNVYIYIYTLISMPVLITSYNYPTRPSAVAPHSLRDPAHENENAIGRIRQLSGDKELH